MNRFSILQASTIAEAAGAAKAGGDVRLPVLKAGGIDLLDLMKEGILEPDRLVNLRTVGDPALRRIDVSDAGGSIGALCTLSDLSAHDGLRKLAPVIARAVEFAASPQVRNVATAGGNLLQRPRCWYFRNLQFECLKRGGSECFAVPGENRYHAIFGGGPCHIVHPSNLAPALWVLDGMVHLEGGDRASLSVRDLYHLPDRGIRDEHNLRPGEVITRLSFKAAPVSGFHAVKEKQSFDWPLVFACVALDVDGRSIAGARVCAGAVAPVPWPLPAVEAALKGVAVDDAASILKACDLAAEGAVPLRDNGYKTQLLRVAVRRAIANALGKEA